MNKQKVFLYFVIVISPLFAKAEKIEINGIWYNLIAKVKQAEVTTRDPVYEWGDDGLKVVPNPNYIGDITIPPTITYEGVLYNVTSITDFAFEECALESITISEGLNIIGRGAFRGCQNLVSISIPKSVLSIGDYAFEGCSELTSAVIPEGITEVSTQLFEGCRNLSLINLPQGITRIGYSAFWGCSSIDSICLPQTVVSIRDNAFEGCSKLSRINLPQEITSIGFKAFYGCCSLTSIILPKGLKNIEKSVFENCSNLTSICVPEEVTSIEDNAFKGCKNLSTIILPKNLRYIRSEAFANCTELLDVFCNVERIPNTSSNAFNGSLPEYVTLHVPSSAVESYRTTAPWSKFGTIKSLIIKVSDIVFSQTTLTLVEGDSFNLDVTIIPDDANDKSVIWFSNNTDIAVVDEYGKVTGISKGSATIIVTANDGSGVSASCEVMVKERILGKCTAPTITYRNSKVELACEMEGAEIYTEVVSDNAKTYQGSEFDFVPTYTFNAYTAKEQYANSDTIGITVCWIECAEEHEDSPDTSIIPSKTILVQNHNGVISLSGLVENSIVSAYDISGCKLAETISKDGKATLVTELFAGTPIIIRIGVFSIKIKMK